MANEIEGAFGKMLESHLDVPAETAMTSIRDPSFAVLRLTEDLPFFAQLHTVLCATPEVRAHDQRADRDFYHRRLYLQDGRPHGGLSETK